MFAASDLKVEVISFVILCVYMCVLCVCVYLSLSAIADYNESQCVGHHTHKADVKWLYYPSITCTVIWNRL